MSNSQFDIATMKSKLLDMQKEIEVYVAASSESRRPVELDQASVGRLSRMDALQQQAMAMATQRQRHKDLARIQSALRRIEDGEFGFCVNCGEEIPAARLQLDPATPACVACAGAKT